MTDRPNIVYVLTDDQGYGDTGFSGNPWIKTPNLDHLYNESVVFTDFHTGPTCAPTRASLMTGRYHNSTGVWHTIGGRSLLRKDEITIATALRRAGYKTGIFGKWHLGDCYPYRPQDRGFDEAIVHGGGGIGQTPDYWGNNYFDDTYFDMGRPRPFRGYCTDVFFNLGMDFMERNKERPFFCYIPTNAPHSPLQIEEEYVKPYRTQMTEDRARFYGMIARIDENMGKLRTYLEMSGLAKNTILIFMTDNGSADGCKTDANGFVTEGYNMGMRGKKGSEYEGGHHTPFLLHWPDGGLKTHKKINELTASIDLMPTLLDLCGMNDDESKNYTSKCDGKSLLPLIKDEKTNWTNRIVVTDSQRLVNPIKWKSSCCMKNKWRLINGRELYNLVEDPEQRWNVSGDHRELAEEMRKGYEDWWKKVSVQFDEDIPISIGADGIKVTVLTSHDIRGSDSDCAWNQGQVRQGMICRSYWEILAEKEGNYRFEIRRWPLEENRPIREGIPGEIVDWWTGGKTLDIIKAELLVDGEICQTCKVNNTDLFSEFTLTLAKGNHHISAYFIDTNDIIRNAYYTYVTLIQ
ncbi:MAG: arylsulfatase [Treponema sp.]|nr:arylsulfatase [Treponema sp.]